MIEFAQALTAVTAAIGLAKELSSTEREVGKAELKLKAAELMCALADAKIALTETHDEIAQRDREIAKLRENFAKVGEMIEYCGYYYEMKDRGPVGFPYCPHCKSDGKWSRLTPNDKLMEARCPNCQNVFGQISDFSY